MDDLLTTLTLTGAVTLIHEGALSPVDLVEACLDRIEQLNPRLNAFLYVAADQARREAHQAADALARGEDWGVLHGIPLGVKDLIDVEGMPTTAGSSFLRGHVAAEDAEVITHLKAAGAILIGKTHLHEFAIGATNVNPHYGPARNPWNPDLSPGGSSGGSGAALAADMCLGALGTDTGGSVRVPAALCGITGLRPAVGMISTRGVFPMSATLDTVGPMARAASDLALMLDVMTHRPEAHFGRSLAEPIKGLRVGIPADDFFWSETVLDVVGPVRAAADTLADLGLEIVEVRLPGVEDTIFAAGVIGLVDAALVHRERLAEHPEGYGADVRARLELALARPAVDYAQAMAVMRAWQPTIRRVLREQADVLLTPTTPVVEHPIAGSEGVSAAKELLRFTYPFSLSMLPSLSMPCGFTPEGLPVGAQLIGMNPETLLRVVHAFQGVTDWHTRRPDLARQL
ncbi:MAG: Asp-tRNA(Asn)/Glu-tRNA(Gln) amidotransferase GatCAB subunit A [Anaerolineae bacterium]